MSNPPSTLVHRSNSNENPPQSPPQQPQEAQEQYGHQRRYPEQQRTTSKPLNFKKAMDDFQTMFPEIDRHAIESVLRANNGVVQSTIDQLLILQESCAPGVPAHEDNYDMGGLPSYESSICNGEEPPPAYSAVWEETTPQQPPPPPPSQQPLPHSTNSSSVTGTTPVLNREESIKKQSVLFANSRWKAPLVGELPVDFLRIETSPPPPSLNNLRLNNTRRSSPSSSSSFSPLHSYSGGGRTPIAEKADMSEDEKLAVYLQNEEFLHELRRNQEFVSSLEADHRRAVMSTEPESGVDEPDTAYVEPVSAFTTAESVSSGGARPRTAPQPQATMDDVAFRQKLKHMGKSTKKKFSKMAKRFSRRNSGNRPQFLHSSDSTFNLLENDNDGDYQEEGLLGINEEEDVDEADENLANNNSRGIRNTYSSSPSSRQLPKLPGGGNRRQLPQPGGGNTNTYEGPAGTAERTGEEGENVEPIVFYSEDNEFAYKNE